MTTGPNNQEPHRWVKAPAFAGGGQHCAKCGCKETSPAAHETCRGPATPHAMESEYDPT